MRLEKKHLEVRNSTEFLASLSIRHCSTRESTRVKGGPYDTEIKAAFRSQALSR
jgi:hypothetical protein